MRKFLYTLILLSLVLVSCVEPTISELEKQAKEAFKTSLNTMGEDGKDVQINNLKAVFSSNNLCILNADVSGIKGLNKVEYLFLTLDGKNYEAFQDLNDDSIFVSEPTYNKICKGTIYENQDYATGIVFRSINYLNISGREVGNHKTDFFINSPLKTGAWELCDVADEFGEKVNGKCLRLIGKGTYSTEYENDKELNVLLFVGEYGYSYLMLIKDGSHRVNEFDGRIKIKDGEGDIHEIYFTYKKHGVIYPAWEEKDEIHGEGRKEFRAILDKEGVLSMLADVGGGLLSPKCSYKFKLHLDGFNRAMNILHPQESNDNQFDESDYDDEGFDIEDSESEGSEPVADEELEKISFNPETESIKEETNTVKSNNDIVSSFDTPPSFEDGDINAWISNRMRYPQEAKEMGQQGKVFVSFVIEKDGSTSGVTIVKSISRELDAEAIRLVKLMKWRPAKLKGENVRSKYNLVVPFYL